MHEWSGVEQKRLVQVAALGVPWCVGRGKLSAVSGDIPNALTSPHHPACVSLATELYVVPLEGSTTFLQPSSTSRMAMESYQLAE